MVLAIWHQHADDLLRKWRLTEEVLYILENVMDNIFDSLSHYGKPQNSFSIPHRFSDLDVCSSKHWFSIGLSDAHMVLYLKRMVDFDMEVADRSSECIKWWGVIFGLVWGGRIGTKEWLRGSDIPVLVTLSTLVADMVVHNAISTEEMDISERKLHSIITECFEVEYLVRIGQMIDYVKSLELNSNQSLGGSSINKKVDNDRAAAEVQDKLNSIHRRREARGGSV